MRIGIDPDIKGGIATIRNDNSIALFDMPTMPAISSRGRKIEVDSMSLSRLLAAIIEASNDGAGQLCIHIEHVHSTPQMGVVSAFKFGQTFGMIYGVALSTGVQVRKVSPQQWKRSFGLLGTPKDASRLQAIENYPQLESRLKLKKDVGKADALWIALA